MQCVRQLCRSARSPQDLEVVALSALSITFGLKILEAVSAAPDGQVHHFTSTKGRRGEHHLEMGLWARRWGDFLARLRVLAGHHPHRPTFFAGKLQLQANFAALLQAKECCCRTIRWHSWRQFGAAQLQSLGLPLHLIQIWGGWNCPAIARIYATPPSGWSFVKGGPCLCPSGKAKVTCPLGKTFQARPSQFFAMDPWGIATGSAQLRTSSARI